MMPVSDVEKDGKEVLKILTPTVKESMESVFNTIAGSVPEYVGDDESEKIGDGVVGIISFSGDIPWLLMLALQRESAHNIASVFCGFDVDYDSPEMGDVVGELANVMAGDVISRLKAKGIHVEMSLPNIMCGHDVEPLLPRGTPMKKMHFKLPQGRLMVKVAGGRGDQHVRRPGA